MLKALLVPYHLNSDYLLRLVIEAFESLPKTAISKSFHHFVAVSEMIFHYNLVVAAFVVIAVVIDLG